VPLTRAVTESKLYVLAGVDVVMVPGEELGKAHENYVSMAVVGKVTEDQRGYFEDASMRRVNEQGAQAIASGGTDLLLAFDKPSRPYPVVDCALIHVGEIAGLGMS
jgi:aspartate racemase